MEITVKFQGIIADMLGRKTAQIALPHGATVEDLLIRLTGDDETARAVLKQTRAFIDGKQADRAAPLENGAEVIFMRPIAGGLGPHPQPLSHRGERGADVESGCPAGARALFRRR